MKASTLPVLFLLLFSGLCVGQPFPGPDKSPMDMAYFPDNFAHDRKAGEGAIVRVTYSRPHKNGREVFGQVVPYGQVWRTGANEATEIKFYEEVEWNGKKVKAGSYALFSIPAAKLWTIMLSRDLDYWGAYSYQAGNDVVRVTAPARALEEAVETFTIQFEKKGPKQAVMKLAWDKTVVEVPFRWQ